MTTSTQRPPASATLGATFAERKAARGARGELAPTPKRLVRVGEGQTAIHGRNGRMQTIDVEMWVDPANWADMYQRALPYGDLQAVRQHAEPEHPDGTVMERIELPKSLRVSSGTYHDAPADTVEVLPPLTPQEREIGRTMGLRTDRLH